jgi:hypothetical protein
VGLYTKKVIFLKGFPVKKLVGWLKTLWVCPSDKPILFLPTVECSVPGVSLLAFLESYHGEAGK